MTLERLIVPPTDASKVPDAIGIRMASAASPEIEKLLAIARTVLRVGKSSGIQIVKIRMIRSQT
jgi:hypothetical protein